MPRILYRNKLPPPEAFQRDLSEAMANASPVDDLLELADDLRQFEAQYKRSSDKFYAEYRAGLLDDELQHNVEWAATYETFLKTKRRLESALMRAVIQPEILEPAV